MGDPRGDGSDGNRHGRVDARADLLDAIAAANVGTSVLGTDLRTLDAVGVSGSETDPTVVITLPIPDPGIRRELEAELDALEGWPALTVEWRPTAADPGKRIDLLPDVKNVIAVASGKGGVGKSTVAVNLAVALADAGASVGLLDADVYGPNAPSLLGLSESTPTTTTSDEIIPREAHGVRVMSMDFVVDEEDPVIWRGPIVDDLLTQFAADVRWGELDYLIVDLPPGTGDAQLTLVQHLPVAGAAIVTTPQSVAIDDARRGIRQFQRYEVPLLGVIENMAGFQCPDCGHDHDLFGSGGGTALAEEAGAPFLGAIPLDPAINQRRDVDEQPPGISLPLLGQLQLPRTKEERARATATTPIVLSDDDASQAFQTVATRLAVQVNRQAVTAERTNG